MAQTRKLRDGTIGVASTIYLPQVDDTKASAIAKKLSQARKSKVSKARVLVETVTENLDRKDPDRKETT